MQLDSTILTEFKKITGKDIAAYFQNVATFFSSDYNTIVSYFSGNSTAISSEPFANFQSMQNQNREVMAAFKEHSRQFNNLKWWLLIEQLEEIDTRLATLANINKWSRSSLTKVAYDPSFQLTYTTKQKQTLESISQNIEGSDNPFDDWAAIALRNNLEEEDYTPEGGVEVNLVFNRVNRNVRINCVVDVIQGKSIYGKDVYRKIQWVKDNGYLNLQVLNYDDTIMQAISILTTLKQNDNPDYPNHGLLVSLIAGTNRALFNFPVIIRQKSQDFANDDTLKNFSITNLSRDQDGMNMEFQVSSRLGEVIADTVSL